jgi:hypothetical protein
VKREDGGGEISLDELRGLSRAREAMEFSDDDAWKDASDGSRKTWCKIKN